MTTTPTKAKPATSPPKSGPRPRLCYGHRRPILLKPGMMVRIRGTHLEGKLVHLAVGPDGGRPWNVLPRSDAEQWPINARDVETGENVGRVYAHECELEVI